MSRTPPGDRTAPTPCGSCGATDVPLERIVIPGHGPISACANPTACRERAIAAGTWCRYEPEGAMS